MAEKSLDEIEKAFLVAASGPEHLVSGVTMPFFKDVNVQLKDAGFRDSLEAFDIPPDLFPRREFRLVAAVPLLPFLICATILLGTSIGSWAVGKVCDAIFDEKIKPALRRLAGKLRKEEYTKDLTFQFGVWYDVDQVYVLVIADVKSPEELTKIEGLVRQAQEAALSWIDLNGITSRVLTYRIRHGELAGRPALSDSAPRE